MPHRSEFSLLLVLVTAIGTFGCSEADVRPNVVFIVSDDQGFGDFGFMGHDRIRTPHIDRLAEESVQFTQAYVPTAMCRPSLATLMTGLYPHQHGVYFNTAPDGGQPQAERHYATLETLPRRLAQAGYATLQAGKHWEGHHRNGGFTDGLSVGNESYLARHPILSPFVGPFGDRGLLVGREGMEPVFDLIDAHQHEPFLLLFAPLVPHVPFTPPRALVREYRERGVHGPAASYYAMVTWFDEMVGALLEHLERRGLREKTLVVLLADNGFALARRGNPGFYAPRSKASPYELGVRTPLLLHHPARFEAAEHDVPVSTVDVVPTVLDFVGLSDGIEDLPGRSLLGVAEGRERLEPRPVFGADYRPHATALDAPGGDVLFRWVRNENWKLIVPAGGDGPMLFDLSRDPGENDDLADDPDLAEIRARLMKMLDGWWRPNDA